MVIRDRAGVMRAHGELVDQQSPVRGFEKFDGQYAGYAETLGNSAGDFGGPLESGLVCAGGRAEHLRANTVCLNSLHQRPSSKLATRASGT